MRLTRGTYDGVALPRWYYKGGETITLDGENDAAATIPGGTTIFVLAAEGGNVYFEINGSFATPNSPGFVASGSGVVVGPLAEFSSLHVFSSVNGVVAHIMYFEER